MMKGDGRDATTEGRPAIHEGIAAGGSIAAAFRELQASLRSSKESHERRNDPAYQWQLLCNIAQQRKTLTTYKLRQWNAQIAGGEHDCRHVESERCWYKVTKPQRSGSAYDFQRNRVVDATPMHYLRRWMLHNKFFEPAVDFVGLERHRKTSELRIAIRQPHIDGSAPTFDQIEAWMQRFGFRNMPGARLFTGTRVMVRDKLWVFDIKPMNFVIDHSQRIYPIDVIV